MATYPYTYADLKASVNNRIHNKFGMIANQRALINDAVNEVSGVYLRTAKRAAVLAPNLFNDIYQYGAPSDLDGTKVIDIQPQSMNRSRNNLWEFITEAEFDARKQTEYNLIAVAEHTFVRTLLVSSRNDGLRELSIAALQGTSGDGSGSWTAFGQATNLQTDNYNFIKGSGSLEFDIMTGGNTAGVSLATVNTFDLTYYISAASIFTWVYLNNASKVTSITTHVGRSASNYYGMTVTTKSDGTAFNNGWNLIRFDFNSKTITGTPVVTSCTYVALYLNLVNSTVVDTGYRFNWFNAKQGNISNIIYYSSFPWQSNTGTLMNKSLADSDYIVADQDEYSLFVEKATEWAARSVREYQDSKDAQANYLQMVKDYKRSYPTESLPLTQTVYYIGSRGNNHSNSMNIIP